MSKQKIILFGAGLGGKRAYKSLHKEYDIIAFVDNDSSKHGTMLMKKPVNNPQTLTDVQYDKIFISSMYASEIMYQLRQDLDISPDRIALVPTEILNGDDEVPWGCLSIIIGIVLLAGFGIYSLFT
jgi:FlaA1/EpsC-like NDP-sugar epimerase